MLAMQEQHFYIGYNQIISKQCFGFWFFGLFGFLVFWFFLGGGYENRWTRYTIIPTQNSF